MAEINIKELFRILLRKWWLIFICVVLAGGTMVIWTRYYLTPLYQASTTVYVGKNADERGLSTADLYLGTSLIQDYSEIAKSRLVASEVIRKLGYNISPEALSRKINISQKPETRVIQILVVDPNPQVAMDIANMEAEVFRQKVAEIMQIDNVQIIDTAVLPTYPVSPNPSRNLLIGIILGFAIGAGITLLMAVLDDSVKTPEDIKKYVGLPVLGTIPVFQPKKRGT